MVRNNMLNESSNASAERILALLLLLMQGEYSREELYAKIDAYQRDAEPESQRRMFDRDIATIRSVGIQVEHKAGKYSIPMAQFERKARILQGEQMHPTALDRGLMLWVPR
jgi:predicted DNA-binding transcriptional regulator YafY